MNSPPAGVPPRKRFGQHFLEPVWAAKVVEAIGPLEGQTLLEIGPGRGAITRLLAGRVRHMLAFEIDRDLAAGLRSAPASNVHVVEGDFLEMTSDALRAHLSALDRPLGDVRVAGNLPYNVASPILFKLVELFEAGIPIVDASVMLQKEVADRLLAAPGTKEYGVLTILIRHHADAARLLQLPAGAFRPAPKVQSTLVRLRFHPAAPVVQSPRIFARLVQAMFTRRRKMLANALLVSPDRGSESPTDLLIEAGLDPRRRPETLSLDEVARLADVIANARGANATRAE